MAILKATFSESNELRGVLVGNDDDNTINADLSNEIVIKDVSVYSNTTEGWGQNPSLISKKNVIYVYTDYDTIDGVPIPGIKIGDGKAYLIDMPFVDGNKELLERHIQDTSIHVTPEEKEFWNNKVRSEVHGDDGTLVFTIY